MQNEELVMRHYRLIRAVAGSVAHRTLTDDAIGEALMRVVGSASRIDCSKQPRSFIVAQAAGAARDFLRKEACHGTAGSTRGTVIEHVAFTGRELARDNLLEVMALQKCGLTMLSVLPDRERSIVLLRYWHGLNQREIATELGVTPCRVWQLLTKAHKRIKAELARRSVHRLADVA